MLTNLKSFFLRSNNKLSAEFDQQVKLSIQLIENNEDSNTDDDIIKLLTSNGIKHFEAIEILLFLPVAFTRYWLTAVKWSDIYFELTDNNRTKEKKYSDTKSYQIIYQVTAAYFNNKPIKETVLKIAGRSAEFKALNELLKNSPNSKLEDIELSQVIVR